LAATRAAAKWVRHVRRRIASLSLHPLRCELIPEDDESHFEYRHLLFGNYRVIYRVQDDVVLVMRVFHASRILRRGNLS
jgi:plasmid stabilization system protein ParE